MAISKNQKKAFNEELKLIKNDIDAKNKTIASLHLKRKENLKLSGYYIFEIVVNQLALINDSLKVNDLSVEILGIKNDKYLNEGRKEMYKILQLMEEAVGADVDRSLRENDEFIQKINKLTPTHILELIKKINGTIRHLKIKFGEGSKWKWSFVELQARAAVITKNITNFSDVAKYRDPRLEFFYERQDLLLLAKEGLDESAKLYRNKYELSGKSRDDLKKSIELLSALRKIHVLFGEDGEATKLKNTIDASKLALESEDNSKKKKKK